MAGEGAAPSRRADLAFTGVYKTPLHGWATHRFAESYEGPVLHGSNIAESFQLLVGRANRE